MEKRKEKCESLMVERDLGEGVGGSSLGCVIDEQVLHSPSRQRLDEIFQFHALTDAPRSCSNFIDFGRIKLGYLKSSVVFFF
ncbi:hypothetical protein J5N97_003592 [Dioscorea zingiberensis]|uniref:Uncharacterized protein n=1 Tax=Dioscorea zingiberensis TaxID=325984 RepID=A0A9D5D4H8_9LILI|nr:hypothetical protein J5N97_003592 [Dioscorea zingiberensis]